MEPKIEPLDLEVEDCKFTPQQRTAINKASQHLFRAMAYHVEKMLERMMLQTEQAFVAIQIQAQRKFEEESEKCDG